MVELYQDGDLAVMEVGSVAEAILRSYLHVHLALVDSDHLVDRLAFGAASEEAADFADEVDSEAVWEAVADFEVALAAETVATEAAGASDFKQTVSAAPQKGRLQVLVEAVGAVAVV